MKYIIKFADNTFYGRGGAVATKRDDAKPFPSRRRAEVVADHATTVTRTYKTSDFTGPYTVEEIP